MFDNVLYQDACKLLASDIQNNTLPQSMLLAGPQCSGKFTSALEIARVLSCQEQEKGKWQCTCSSCLMHKSLVSPDVLIAGNKSCTTEIEASRKTLTEAYELNASWLLASRYLYVRSIRKLTARFNHVLWEGDDKASKIGSLIADISEILEELDPLQDAIEFSQFEKRSNKLQDLCTKLETTYLYDSIPVSHIRKASSWAHYTIAHGKRVFIIENAERMQEGVRNALLKILEEPPEHCVFILTTENKNAVMPTILSRLRVYSFYERNTAQNEQVLKRIFRIHDDTMKTTLNQSTIQASSIISTYLNNFLPVSSESICSAAQDFLHTLEKKEIPNVSELLKHMKNFEPRIILKLFFNAMLDVQRKKILTSPSDQSAAVSEKSEHILKTVKYAYSNITIYNQSTQSAFDSLIYDILKGA